MMHLSLSGQYNNLLQRKELGKDNRNPAERVGKCEEVSLLLPTNTKHEVDVHTISPAVQMGRSLLDSWVIPYIDPVDRHIDQGAGNSEMRVSHFRGKTDRYEQMRGRKGWAKSLRSRLDAALK